MTRRPRWNWRGSSSIPVSEARAWTGTWPPGWPAPPGCGIRACSCGSIRATSPRCAVTPLRASCPSSPIRRPSGTSASRSTMPGSAWPRNVCTRLNRPSVANGLRRWSLWAGALAVLAPWPAAGPALALLQLLAGPADAAFPGHLLPGVPDPADEVVPAQGRDVLPGIKYRRVGAGLPFLVPAIGFASIQATWGRYTVARCLLALSGRLPWRLTAFLQDAAVNRGALRQFGAVYQFRHVEIQRRLAKPIDQATSKPVVGGNVT